MVRLVALSLILGAPLFAQTAEDLVVEGRRARAEGRLEAAADLFRRAAEADAARPAPALLLAETLAWQKRFDEAEQAYRQAIERFGSSRDARLGLGRVLLWKGEYGEARRLFSSALEENADDLDAREELARTWYWSGDFRTAEREFDRIVQRDPSRKDSQRALAEIRRASAPGFAVRALHRSDDQPFQLDRTEVELSLFSDPLTRWKVTGGAYQSDEPSESSPFLGVETEITLAAARLTIAPTLRILSFPDGENELLGGLRISRKILRSSMLSIVASRSELLLNREAADDHPYVTDVFLAYDLATAGGRLARARAGASRFFDRNEGVWADAYFLAPVYRGEKVTVSLGAAAAYRDTDENRFRIERGAATPLAPGSWSYRWEGVYDPYWTPIGLKEVRAIASVGSGTDSRIFWNVQLSGGAARDRAIGFGPSSGSDPLPPVPFAVDFEREYEPWNGAASVELPISGETRLRFDYEHMRSVYYEADEFRAAMVGRF